MTNRQRLVSYFVRHKKPLLIGALCVVGSVFFSLLKPLIPLAVVYTLAHAVSLLVYQAQSLPALASDPLGRGSDVFGTWLRDGFGALAAGWTVEPSATTVSVGITHPNGERTFFTSQGHLPALSFPAVRGMLESYGLSGKWMGAADAKTKNRRGRFGLCRPVQRGAVGPA